MQLTCKKVQVLFLNDVEIVGIKLADPFSGVFHSEQWDGDNV